MNNINIFYQTSVQGDAAQNNSLKKAGDFCLTPVRYFFHGRNVSFVTKEGILEEKSKISIGDIASYTSKKGSESTRKNWKSTCLCIIGFIPGLILGSILKGLSYINQSIRNEHEFVKLHFIREEHLLIDKQPPNSKGANAALVLTARKADLEHPDYKLNQRVKFLEINLSPSTTITEQSIGYFIKKLDPEKLILHGTVFIERDRDRWTRRIVDTGKWLTGGEGDKKKLAHKSVSTVAEALADQTPLRPNNKPFKCIYVVN